MRVLLPEIRHSLSGFHALARLYAQTKDCLFAEIQIDMSQVSWFDADMCAAFGAILCLKASSYAMAQRLIPHG